MAGQPLIEIREWGRPVRRRVLDGPVIFGRDGSGEVLADNGVSRRHLRLVPTPTALSVVDLGSRNGTTVNGVPLSGRHVLAIGDVVRLGSTEILVLHAPTAESGTPAPAETAHGSTGMLAPPPPGERQPSPAIEFANRILGIDPSGERNLFPSFAEMTSRVPLRVWQAVRFTTVVGYLALIVLLFTRPAAGLFWFFQVIVPILPGLFLIAPGLWRNACPLAATNQSPRLFGFTRALTPPEWLRERGYLIAVTLFTGIVGARLAGLDHSGVCTGLVLLAAIVSAFLGGLVFKGKSGWCSSVCPLFPLQRAYGQTPFVTVANNHCDPCVGCAKNCYDFAPRGAYQADLNSGDRAWIAPRKLFAAALPGLVLGFFVLYGHQDVPIVQRYAVLAVFLLAAIGVFFALESTTSLSPGMLTAGYAAVALNIFYWFAGSVLAGAMGTLTGLPLTWLHWPISLAVLGATVVWLARTRVSELQYALHTGARTEPVLLPLPRLRVAEAEKPAAAAASVLFEPGGTRIAADLGMSLLDIAEKGALPLEAGCRMGVCGADPVAVLEGADQLCEPTADERKTLRRLGFADNTRMACCARVTGGAVRVGLTPAPGTGNSTVPAYFDRSIVSVVVIGNGIAGVTAADFLRRGHPDCEIHLIGREPHGLYNRMGISRLVYGRSAMQGLHLLPDQWYDDHQITAWLNTLATGLDLRAQRVHLGTGDVLPYDRLVLAMGSTAAAPAIDGLHRPGSFVLREAEDAMRIRAYAQQHGSTRAVVAGGGLLGLEAAYALRQLGLQVTVLERADRLLRKQLDPRCSALVRQYFARAGIEVRHRAETVGLTGESAVRPVADPLLNGSAERDGRSRHRGEPSARRDQTARLADSSAVRSAILADGTVLPCDLFLTATGIRPAADLARRAGLPVRRGILVDDHMRTRAPGVYAAGDVAEHRDRVLGLWPIAAEQAETAAINALGGNRTLVAETPATILKGVGLELFSIGQVDPRPGDEVVVLEVASLPSYRRLIISHGRAVGATILGHHPADAAAAQQAVRNRIPLSPSARAAIRAGDWSVLAIDPQFTGAPTVPSV